MEGLNFPGNVSFSSFKVLKECERRFFYEKVIKGNPSNFVETKYGRFGNCVHEAIEDILNYSSVEESVRDKWQKFKLYDTDMNIESAIKQVKYALDLEYEFLEKEQKIFFSIGNLKFKLIIDGVLKDGSILDWKTSTFASSKVEEYKEQLLWYSWGIYRAKGYVPTKAVLVFTKAEKIFTWCFTEQDILNFEKHIREKLQDLNDKESFSDFVPNFKSCYFCGYKNQCNMDTLKDKKDLLVELEYNHDFVKILTPMPMIFNQKLENILSYKMDGAYFVKKAMLARGVTNFDGVVRMYRNQKCSLGFLSEIKKYLRMYAESLGVRLILREYDKRVLLRDTISVPSSLNNVNLYEYQEKAVEHIIQDKISMTEICTGAGKTFIAAELIRRLGFRTLFVVDRNILLQQTVDEFKSVGLENIGTVTEGKSNWNDITIASIQTLISKVNKGDFETIEEISKCNVVIVDEAHGAKSKSYQKLMSNVGAEYRIGLTGTAYSDGSDSLELYKSFGFPSLKIRAIDLINAGYLVRPEIEFLTYEGEQRVLNGSYEEVYSEILKLTDRVKTVQDIISRHTSDNILLMVDRIEHIEMMEEHLSDMNLHIIQGKTSKKDRDKIVNILRSTRGNLLIATSSIIQKGVNIPSLDVIINYSANLGSVKTIQCLGRVLRRDGVKDKAYYYDFYDQHKMLLKHTKARIKALKEQGYEIK